MHVSVCLSVHPYICLFFLLREAAAKSSHNQSRTAMKTATTSLVLQKSAAKIKISREYQNQPPRPDADRQTPTSTHPPTPTHTHTQFVFMVTSQAWPDPVHGNVAPLTESDK